MSCSFKVPAASEVFNPEDFKVLTKGKVSEIDALIQKLRQGSQWNQDKEANLSLILSDRFIAKRVSNQLDIDDKQIFKKILQIAQNPIFNEEGLCTQLLIYSKNKNITQCKNLINILHDKKVQCPLLEVFLGYVSLGHEETYIFHTLSEYLLNSNLLEIKNLITLKRLQPHFDKHAILHLNELDLEILPEDDLISLALRNKAFRVLEVLDVILLQFKNPQFAAMMDNLIKKHEKILLDYLYTQYPQNYKSQENIRESYFVNWFIQNGSPEDRAKIHLLHEYAQVLRSFSRSTGFNFRNTDLVAKHPEESKKDRMKLKKLLGEILNKIPQTERPSQEELQNLPKEAVFYFKKDKYELVKTRLGKMVPPTEIILIKNGTEKLVLPPSFESIFKVEHLSHLFKGSSFEYLNEMMMVTHALHNQFWDNDFVSNVEEEYQTLVYPALSKAAIQILESLQGSTKSVMEICGGAGILAQQILDKVKSGHVTYHLLELNDNQLAKAKLLLGERAQAIKTDIVNDEHYFIDEGKKIPMKANSIDLVVGSGALTYEVLSSKEDALKALKKVHHYLRPGGHLILAGYRESFLSSEDFIKEGFAVINTHLPNSPKQFYIVRKNTL